MPIRTRSKHAGKVAFLVFECSLVLENNYVLGLEYPKDDKNDDEYRNPKQIQHPFCDLSRLSHPEGHQYSAGVLTRRAEYRFARRLARRTVFQVTIPKLGIEPSNRWANSKARLRFKMAAYPADGVVYISFE